MEKAADLPAGSFVAGRYPDMSDKLALAWWVMDTIEQKAESLKHWLVIEQMWPTIKINSKRIPEAPA